MRCPSYTAVYCGEGSGHHLLSDGPLLLLVFLFGPGSSFLMPPVSHRSPPWTALPLWLASCDWKSVELRRGSQTGWDRPQVLLTWSFTPHWSPLNIFFPYSRWDPRLLTFWWSPYHDSKVQCQLPLSCISFFTGLLPPTRYHLPLHIKGPERSSHCLPAPQTQELRVSQ